MPFSSKAELSPARGRGPRKPVVCCWAGCALRFASPGTEGHPLGRCFSPGLAAPLDWPRRAPVLFPCGWLRPCFALAGHLLLSPVARGALRLPSRCSCSVPSLRRLGAPCALKLPLGSIERLSAVSSLWARGALRLPMRRLHRDTFWSPLFRPCGLGVPLDCPGGALALCHLCAVSVLPAPLNCPCGALTETHFGGTCFGPVG